MADCRYPLPAARRFGILICITISISLADTRNIIARRRHVNTFLCDLPLDRGGKRRHIQGVRRENADAHQRTDEARRYAKLAKGRKIYRRMLACWDAGGYVRVGSATSYSDFKPQHRDRVKAGGIWIIVHDAAGQALGLHRFLQFPVHQIACLLRRHKLVCPNHRHLRATEKFKQHLDPVVRRQAGDHGEDIAP